VNPVSNTGPNNNAEQPFLRRAFLALSSHTVFGSGKSTNMSKHAHWKPDGIVLQCENCKKKFSLLTRKHHCRRCGRILCSGCSAAQVRFVRGSQKAKRVCEACAAAASSEAAASAMQAAVDYTMKRTKEREVGARKKVGASAKGSRAPTQALEAAASAQEVYKTALRERSEHVQDSATGSLFETATQLIHVRIDRGGSSADAGTAAEENLTCKDILDGILKSWGVKDSNRLRLLQAKAARAGCATILASAGTGKSWLMQQLQLRCAKSLMCTKHNIVPIFITVQTIAARLHTQLIRVQEAELVRRAGALLTMGWLLVLVAEQLELPDDHEQSVIGMLSDAVATDRVLFVFDGIDEGGVVREVVESFILSVGFQHHVLATGRPEGVRRELYVTAGYLMLSLQPLTPKQQQTMIDRRLTDGSDATKFFKNLVDFRESRARQDSLHAENFPLGRIERLKEIKGDEKQYVAEAGGRLVDNQTALFERAGQAKPIFDTELRKIAKATGTVLKRADLKGTTEKCVVTVDENGDEVTVETAESYSGQLRNPVPRLAVKAWDDELKRLQEAGEVGKDKAKVAALFRAWKAGATVDKAMAGLATVKDVVRASLMCDSEEQMVQVFDAICLNKNFDIARFKNYFAKLGPTHFRRIGLNLRVQLPDGGSHVVELQVHHTQIYENAPDHEVYEYFRDVFVGGEFNGKMDDLIGKRMNHLEGVMQVPVFMSLLIVCVDGGNGPVPEVPATVAELYQTAMTKLYQQRGDRDGFDGQQMQRLMRAIFTQNQLRRRRQFGHADVVSALQDATSAAGAQDSFDELMVLWNRQVDEGTAPFVKILVKAVYHAVTRTRTERTRTERTRTERTRKPPAPFVSSCCCTPSGAAARSCTLSLICAPRVTPTARRRMHSALAWGRRNDTTHTSTKSARCGTRASSWRSPKLSPRTSTVGASSWLGKGMTAAASTSASAAKRPKSCTLASAVIGGNRKYG
jgi:hypothetical protein